MERQYWKYLKLLPRARSGAEMMQLLAPLANELGFEYCSYALCTSFPIGNPRVALFSNYPPQLHEACSTQSYAKNPLLQHGMHASSALIWSHRIFASSHEFWCTARAWGLCHGWTQSTFSGNSIVGIFTVARASGRIDTTELQSNSMVMTWLTHSIHLSLPKHFSSNILPELATRLTRQEKAVLRWTCEDKSSRQIAEVMGISERTVNFHVRNALAKLKVTSRAAATARAALLGLLD